MHVEFSPYGNFAILTPRGLEPHRGARRQSPDPGVLGHRRRRRSFRAPRCSRPNGRLFVQGSLSRDVARLRPDGAADASSTGRRRRRSPTIPAVASEKLTAQVLAGQEDLSRRLGHPHGRSRATSAAARATSKAIDDGRVYDFSIRGEGLRNTLALLGRAGTAQGRLNWAGDAGRGAGLRAPDPRPVRRHGVHARRRLPRRHARSTARRSEGGPEPGAGRARGVRRRRSITSIPAPTATRTAR